MAVSVAVAVDCALRLSAKVLNLRAKPKLLMHMRPFNLILEF